LEFSIPATLTVVGRTFRGFGTTVGVWTTEPALLPALVDLLERWVVTVESVASRFDPQSDLSRANQRSGEDVPVSPILVSAVESALEMAAATGGLCDPTVGLNVIAAGYDQSFELLSVVGPGPTVPHHPGGGWQLVRVNVENSTVRVPEGFQLDLGGSAKGWAVDRAIEVIDNTLLPAFPGAGVCVSAGGDLAVVGLPPGGGWPITIRERLESPEGVPDRLVRLQRGAMATTGATQRQWQRDGATGHHVIDPRTGEPGDSNWALVTTFADSCLLSDAMATAAWLLGPGAPRRLERCGVGARLLDGNGTEVVVGDLTRWTD